MRLAFAMFGVSAIVAIPPRLAFRAPPSSSTSGIVDIDVGPESSTTSNCMTLPVFAKFTLFLLLRLRISIFCPVRYLRKSMRISYRSPVLCRKDGTASTFGTIPPSVATMYIGSLVDSVSRYERDVAAPKTRKR